MAYLIAALLFWASSFTAGKLAYQAFDPALVVLLRLVIASALVLPFFLKHYKNIDKALKKRLWAVSFLMFPIGILIQFIGLSYTSASSAVTIIGTEPILVLFLGFVFFGKQVAWYDWLLGVLAFFGIFLLVMGAGDNGVVSLFGLLLVFLAGVGFALSLHISQSLMQHMTPKLYTAAILVQGTCLCLPFSLVLTKSWQVNPSPQGVLAVLYLGVCCSFLAYKLWNMGLAKTPARLSGILIALEPVFGVMIAMLFLGERMSAMSALGSVLVIGAASASTLIPMLSRSKGEQANT